MPRQLAMRCKKAYQREVLVGSGVDVTKSPFVNFSVSKIIDLTKYILDSLNIIHIWQVAQQLSCFNNETTKWTTSII